MRPNHTNPTTRALALAALVALGAAEARAFVSIENTNIQIGGFLSQGYLYSDNNNFPTADKGGTWQFREMAVNVSDTIGAHLRIGAQGFAQSFGNIGGDKVILDWAVADYNVSPYFGIRVGRVKYPKGLYGEALDLDVVRPFVFLPDAVYSPILRDFSASFDGGMVYGSASVGKSSFDYKVFYGDIPISPEKGVAEFYNNAGLYADPGVGALSMKSVAGGQLTWNTPVDGLKFAYSYSAYKDLATDGAFFAYPPANLHSNFNSFSWNTISAEYTVGNWVFASEWQRSGGTIQYEAPPVLPTITGKSGWDGWYVSAARRINDRFQIGAYYGDLKDRYGSGDPSTYQHDLAACLRFDLNEHVLFKIEAHSVDGYYQSFNTVRIPNPSPSTRDTVVAIKTTLSF
jgi:hypothetical protein